MLLTSCQPVLMVEPAWITFKNQEYGYEFRYPSEARVDVLLEDASQVKVQIEPANPFDVMVTLQYTAADVFYHLDTPSSGERTIGENIWSEFLLPDGYCDATGCSTPIYALKMEAGNILFTVIFHSQKTTTELQEEILATFKISDQQ
ncbi:MAG: hypothetical protein M3R47_16900 [Chloroflexota bacterium]|nr:hypothetical protein [Chloroflexota bacterium]